MGRHDDHRLGGSAAELAQLPAPDTSAVEASVDGEQPPPSTVLAADQLLVSQLSPKDAVPAVAVPFSAGALHVLRDRRVATRRKRFAVRLGKHCRRHAAWWLVLVVVVVVIVLIAEADYTFALALGVPAAVLLALVLITRYQRYHATRSLGGLHLDRSPAQRRNAAAAAPVTASAGAADEASDSTLAAAAAAAAAPTSPCAVLDAAARTHSGKGVLLGGVSSWVELSEVTGEKAGDEAGDVSINLEVLPSGPGFSPSLPVTRAGACTLNLATLAYPSSTATPHSYTKQLLPPPRTEAVRGGGRGRSSTAFSGRRAAGCAANDDTACAHVTRRPAGSPPLGTAAVGLDQL